MTAVHCVHHTCLFVSLLISRFCFYDRILVLIAPVPGHCLSSTIGHIFNHFFSGFFRTMNETFNKCISIMKRKKSLWKGHNSTKYQLQHRWSSFVVRLFQIEIIFALLLLPSVHDVEIIFQASIFGSLPSSKPVLESFSDIQCVFLEDSRRHCIFL